MASTWVYQKPADVEAKGQSKASWYVEDLDDCSCATISRCKICNPGRVIQRAEQSYALALPASWSRDVHLARIPDLNAPTALTTFDSEKGTAAS